MTVTRRTFLSLAGSTTLAVKAHALPFAFPVPRFAYVAAKGKTSGLCGFALRHPHWRALHHVPAEEPVSLAIHPDGHTLYVLHDVGVFRLLPRGYVSAYRINQQSGSLELMAVQPLSLSATFPRHLAISPSGRFLVASAQGGGAYNLFPISVDGSIGRVGCIRKEVGCGPSTDSQASARPQAVLFTGSEDCVLAVDQGNDTMSILDAGLSLCARVALPPGTGAQFLAIHHASHTGFISGSLSGALLTFRYDPAAATITEPITLAEDFVNGPLALHPTRRILYTAADRGIAVYDFQENGKIRRLQHLDINSSTLQLQSLQYSPQFDALFLSTTTGLLRVTANPASGLLEKRELVSTVPHAHSVVFF